MFCPNHDTRPVSHSIGYCAECLEADHSLMTIAQESHKAIRRIDKLVHAIPATGEVVCPDCGNHCRIEEGKLGFCHLRGVENGEVVERFPGQAIVSWYFDPLPTNCVADWVCPVTQSSSIVDSKRLNNLAVFYGSCNSDCLFCQNASFRQMMTKGRPLMTPQELASSADERTACVCYFGGDPACNASHSIETSRILNEERGIRVCYETNGNISSKWLKPIAEVVRESEGTIKFDLKAVTPELYTGLTGVSNKVVLKNFERLAAEGRERDGEFLVASILLIPGYVGVSEVRKLCGFIANSDPTIPTALLGFHPHHVMRDLPRTSREHAKAALQTAKDAGLSNVRVGNVALLSSAKYSFN